MWFLEREYCKRNREFFGALLPTDHFLNKLHDLQDYLFHFNDCCFGVEKEDLTIVLIDSWKVNKEYAYFAMATTGEIIR